MIPKSLQFAGLWFVVLMTGVCALAQNPNLAKDNLALFGQVRIRVKGTSERTTPPVATLILFSPSGKELARPTGPELARQKVMNGGTYRFSDLTPGEYELAVEIDMHEVSRTRIFLSSLHAPRSEEHTSELQSLTDLVCRLLLEQKKRCYPRPHQHHTH